MKEPKKIKLNLGTPYSKEPTKIRLKPLYIIDHEEDIEKYNIYSLHNDDVYSSKDLEKLKKTQHK